MSTLHWVGRAGHGRHGGEAPALCVGTDDVGLDSLALSHQGERANKLLSKRNWPKPPRPATIRLILLTKILTKPLLLAADLQKHDANERAEHQQGLPSPKAKAHAGVIDETPRQHGVSAQAVGTFRHQVLRAGRDFMTESIHGLPSPLRRM